MKNALRIHIIPIGRGMDDLKRMTLPAIYQKADRVYIFAFPEERNAFKDVLKQVVADLSSALRLKLNVDLFIIRVVFYDFQQYMMEIASIAQKEQSEGNIVFYNIASGGAIPAFAGMQAQMLFDVHPYYPKRIYEEDRVPDPPEILDYSDFFINKPPQELIRFLVNIRSLMEFNKMNINNRDKISKKECLYIFGLLHRQEDVSKRGAGDFNKLKLRYLDKLEALHYIFVEPQRRGKVCFTKTGIFAMEIFANYYQIQSEPESKISYKAVYPKTKQKNPDAQKNDDEDDD